MNLAARWPAAALAIALITSVTFAAPRAPAAAQSGDTIKIAVITDMSGVYAALSGKGAVTATQMAVDDFGGSVLGKKIEVTAIDHRNNPTDAATKAREFFDDGGDLALDLTNSGTALAVSAVGKEKHKLVIVTGGGSSALTGANCDKYTYHYAYDTYALAHSTGTNIAAQKNGKTWYAIYPTYAFGTQMLADFSDAVKAQGGSIVKADGAPLGTTDFSSYVLAAKNAKPQVLGIFSAGADMVNTAKAAAQFGLNKDMKVAIGLLFLADVDALPDVFTGSRITTSWYWDEDAASRAWADKWTKAVGGGIRPTDVQASDYSATIQYLNAVKATGGSDPDKIVSYLDGRKFNDFYVHNGQWRARDHSVVHDMYVVDILPKDKLKAPHAWFNIVETISPNRAFRPESQSVCTKDW
ncbi:MAG: ABC transporter substrate-binding protein [Candidatus Velthaea sp.]|jgi:branched-chain amino acid transport system substrate-binding protein